MSAVSTVALLLLGLIVAQRAADGTLRTWLRAKLTNAGDPPRTRGITGRTPAQTTGARPTLALPLAGPVVSAFGMRRHPITGENKLHAGIDIDGDTGDPVRAAAPGRVIWSGPRGSYGLLVEIDHSPAGLGGAGWTTRYAHLSRATVSIGQTVETGQQIGAVGSTGLSTGPHLHFELRQNGRAVDPASALAGVAS